MLMCVIAVYKKGIKLNYAELKRCFINNPDGAGVMWQDEDSVHIRKGFMTQQDFFQFLKTLPTDVDRVIHCRIATSGKISQACCHPFPVTNDYKRMMATDIKVPVAFAHNGILTAYTPKNGLKAKISDTMVFGKKVLNHLYQMHVNLFDTVIDDMLQHTINTDKMVLMDSHHIVTLGTFITSEVSGAEYSNASYSYDKPSWYKLPVTKQNIAVDFVATVTLDTTVPSLAGYTRDDLEQLVVDNLADNNIYSYDSDITKVDKSKVTIEVGCSAYVDDMPYPFCDLYDGLTLTHHLFNGDVAQNIPVDIKISEVKFTVVAF